MRYFFEIAYHGGRYHGWQTQHNALGVQTVVEDALSRILRTPVAIVGSGRTDTGVHCEQQFFHADIPAMLTPESFLHKINSVLPRDIAIRNIFPVKDDAHARYSARERTYTYRITTVKDPLSEGLSLQVHKPLDLQRMNKAAALLIGRQNFQAFSKVKTDVNHFFCEVKKATWKQKGEKITFTVTSNRFLRGMVRAMVGTMLDVGTGVTSLAQFKDILKSGDRKRAGQNVPPHGLYLSRVTYPRAVFRVTSWKKKK